MLLMRVALTDHRKHGECAVDEAESISRIRLRRSLLPPECAHDQTDDEIAQNGAKIRAARAPRDDHLSLQHQPELSPPGHIERRGHSTASALDVALRDGQRTQAVREGVQQLLAESALCERQHEVRPAIVETHCC